MFQTVINGGQGVFDWEDETGGELLEASSGVHQRRRIGEKVEPGHAIVPALSRMGQPAGGGVESFSLCNIGRDAPEELRRRLDDRSSSVLGQIALSKDSFGMGGKSRPWKLWRAWGRCRLLDGHDVIIYRKQPD